MEGGGEYLYICILPLITNFKINCFYALYTNIWAYEPATGDTFEEHQAIFICPPVNGASNGAKGDSESNNRDLANANMGVLLTYSAVKYV